MSLPDFDPRGQGAIDPPTFQEPWQAQAFAMVVALHERGLFSWADWAEALSTRLAQPDFRHDAGNYYECWLDALETLMTRKGIADPDHIGTLAAAWQRASKATPHGKPILLENDPDRN